MKKKVTEVEISTKKEDFPSAPFFASVTWGFKLKTMNIT